MPAAHRAEVLLGGDARDVIPDEPLEDFIRHVAATGPARQGLLAQVEAVAAVEVARRAGRLGHHVKAPVGARAEPLRGAVFVESQDLRCIRCAHAMLHE